MCFLSRFCLTLILPLLLVNLASPLSTASQTTNHSLTTPTSAWHTRAPLTQARQEMPAAVLDPDPTGGPMGRIYIVGGIDPQRNTVGLAESYDPASDTWRSETPLPDAVDHLGLAALNGKIYAAGGFRQGFSSTSNRLYEYDPVTRTWTQRPNMPTLRAAHVLLAVNGKLYVVGGVGDGTLARVLEYDPASQEWQTKAAMTAPREHLSAAVVGGKIYVIGGRWSGVGNVSTTEVYDPATNLWMPLKPMPTARGGLGAAAVGNKIHVVGGEGPSGTPSRTFPQHEVYSPATDTWTTATPMVTPRHGLGVVGLRGRLFVIAGGPVEGYATSTVNEIFTPCLGDIDADGAIGTPDLQSLAQGWGLSRGETGYNALLDLNADGSVDIVDLASTAALWGQACS